MRFSRRRRSLVGVTLIGNIHVHSLRLSSEICSKFIAQDLSTSTFHELWVFPVDVVSPNIYQTTKLEYESAKEGTRFLKEWMKDKHTYVLLRLPKAPLLTKEDLVVVNKSKSKGFANAARSTISKPVQNSLRKNASIPNLGNDIALLSNKDKRARRKKEKKERSTLQLGGSKQSAGPRGKTEELGFAKSPVHRRGKTTTLDLNKQLTSTLSATSNLQSTSSFTASTSMTKPPAIPANSSVPCLEIDAFRMSISRLYSELPIYPPRNKEATTQATMIRLIELKPTFMGDSILCNMYSVSLQANTKFMALSYAWGDPEKTHTIHVRGYEIPVTKNLHHALIQLRKPQWSIAVWADAICIDQTNMEERNYQVKQMPKIYSAAQEVIAWLGEGTPKSDGAMELITLSAETLKKKKRSSVQRDLDDLFSRSYWSRVWVIQELASAHRNGRACTLQCGSVSVTLDQFRIFLRRLLRQMQRSELKAIAKPRSLLSLSSQDSSRTLLQILWESSSHLATDPRDRIYGIRGISPKFYRDQIDVDYTIDFEKLCTKVMTLMVSKDRCLNVLCYFQGYSSVSPAPSWLRDFSKRNPGIPPERYSCDSGRRASAEIKNRILRTKGVCIGSVERFEMFNERNGWQYWEHAPASGSELKEIETMAFDALERLYQHDEEEGREDRFLEMIAGGKQHSMEQLGQNYRKMWRVMWDKRIGFERREMYPAEWAQVDGFFRNMFGRLVGRGVFISVEGNVGLCPRSTQKNDLVCVIYGCRLPLILIKDGRYYTFIGPAYVDGAMNGEFMQASEKGQASKKERRFWIR